MLILSRKTTQSFYCNSLKVQTLSVHDLYTIQQVWGDDFTLVFKLDVGESKTITDKGQYSFVLSYNGKRFNQGLVGITASRDVLILREELIGKKEKERLQHSL